ncbi:archease [Candidatus Margulisiibacteriota bacterium]
MRFTIIEHPSDVGIEAVGENIKETFENTAFGLYSLIGEIKEIQSKTSFEVKLSGANWEELMINWLNHLIYLHDVKNVLLKDFKVYQLSDKDIKAHVSGEKIKPNLHELYRSIKAATYNQLEVSEKKAKVVFDV